MSSHQPERRRALRSSRPDSGRWLTVMVVFSDRTFRWSLTRRLMLWVLGGVVGFWALAMIGSGYGLWATKKIMSFGRLAKETQEQQEQLRSSLDQAQALESEVATLRKQHTELLKLLDPKAPAGSPFPPCRASRTPLPFHREPRNASRACGRTSTTPRNRPPWCVRAWSR